MSRYNIYISAIKIKGEGDVQENKGMTKKKIKGKGGGGNKINDKKFKEGWE